MTPTLRGKKKAKTNNKKPNCLKESKTSIWFKEGQDHNCYKDYFWGQQLTPLFQGQPRETICGFQDSWYTTCFYSSEVLLSLSSTGEPRTILFSSLEIKPFHFRDQPITQRAALGLTLMRHVTGRFGVYGSQSVLLGTTTVARSMAPGSSIG